MDRTGLLRGKENVEQHVEPDQTVRLSEHGIKVREAREARRKRILARSSERLAFITGEANAIPTSPLLIKNDHPKSCNALVSLASLLNQDTPHQCSPGKEPTIKKGLLFTDHDQTDAHKKPANTSQEGAEVAHRSKSEEAMEASKEQAGHEYTKETPITFKSMFSNCIKRSLFPRLASAVCIALAFLVSGFTQGSRHDLAISFPTMSGFGKSGYFGSLDTLSMICYALASVMLVDLLLFVGAFFLLCGGREHSKVMRNGEALAEKATLSIVVHLLLSMCVDCSISASLLSGGFLVLANVA